MITPIGFVILVFIIGEILAIAIFKLVSKALNQTKKMDRISVVKGILERLVIYVGILSGYPHILTLFGALKIGTRIKNEHPISNDYYLIGNLMSVLLVLIYLIVVQRLTD